MQDLSRSGQNFGKLDPQKSIIQWAGGRGRSPLDNLPPRKIQKMFASPSTCAATICCLPEKQPCTSLVCLSTSNPSLPTCMEGFEVGRETNSISAGPLGPPGCWRTIYSLYGYGSWSLCTSLITDSDFIDPYCCLVVGAECDILPSPDLVTSAWTAQLSPV